MACAASPRPTCHHHAVTATENVRREPRRSRCTSSTRPGTATSTRAAASAATRSCAGSRTPACAGPRRVRRRPRRPGAVPGAPAGRRGARRRAGAAADRGALPDRDRGEPLGPSSVSYRYGVFAGDDCVATGESTSVYVGDDGAAPLPDDLREQLDRHRIAGPEAPAPERGRRGCARSTRSGWTSAPASATWTPTGTSTTSRSRAGTSTPSPSCTSTCSATRPAARSTGSRPARCVHYLAEVHYPAIHQLRVAVVGIDETSVRYACGLFDGPTCVGLAEAVGSCHVAGPATGGPAALEPCGSGLARSGVQAAPATARPRAVTPARRRPRRSRQRGRRGLRGHARAQAEQHRVGKPAARRPAPSRARSGPWRCRRRRRRRRPAAQPAAQGHAARLGALEPGVGRGVVALVEHRLDRGDVEVRVERRARVPARQCGGQVST